MCEVSSSRCVDAQAELPRLLLPEVFRKPSRVLPGRPRVREACEGPSAWPGRSLPTASCKSYWFKSCHGALGYWVADDATDKMTPFQTFRIHCGREDFSRNSRCTAVLLVPNHTHSAHLQSERSIQNDRCNEGVDNESLKSRRSRGCISQLSGERRRNVNALGQSPRSGWGEETSALHYTFPQSRLSMAAIYAKLPGPDTLWFEALAPFLLPSCLRLYREPHFVFLVLRSNYRPSNVIGSRFLKCVHNKYLLYTSPLQIWCLKYTAASGDRNFERPVTAYRRSCQPYHGVARAKRCADRYPVTPARLTRVNRRTCYTCRATMG